MHSKKLRIPELENEKILPIIPTTIIPGHLPSALFLFLSGNGKYY